MNTFDGCDRTRISGYLAGTLEIDDKLEFLMHLDNCASCWNQIYVATKARYQQDSSAVQPKRGPRVEVRVRTVRRKRPAKAAV